MGDELAQAMQGNSGPLAGGGQPAPAPQPGGGGGAMDPEMLKKMMAQQMRTKQGLAPVRPDPSAGKPGFGTMAAGGLLGMFVPALGGALIKSVKQHKETQVNAAVNDYSVLNDELEMADLMAQGDDKKREQIFQDSPRVKAILGDPKKQKNIAKVFSMDWMNPDKGKDSVYHQGLQRFMKLKPASELVKKMSGMIKGHKEQQAQGGGQPQGGQPGGGQPQQAGQNVGQMAQQLPRQMTAPDPNGVKALAEAKHAVDAGEAATREKYDIRPDANGEIVAIDKTDPNKVVRVTDKDGRTVTGAAKGKNGPMLVDSVPVGMYWNGKPYTPNTPGWTAQMAKELETYKAAYATSEAGKDHRIKLAADSRVMSFMNTREYAAISKNGDLVYATPAELKSGDYAPASQGVQAKNRAQIFQEIDYTKNMLKESIAALPDDAFDATSRAQIAAVLRDEDPRSAWQKFLGSSAAETLGDEKQNYVTALIALNESAMSLRSLGGMGGGSDQLRNAIFKMLPGAGTPSKSYANRQLQLFEGEVNALSKSTPHIGKSDAQPSGGGASYTPKSGEKPVRDKAGKLLGYTMDGKHFSKKL
jgi:hypothetical protein